MKATLPISRADPRAAVKGPRPRVSFSTEEKRIEKFLKDQGFEPMDEATKKRLKQSGNWGMPDE